MGKTAENLEKALAGESHAFVRYMAFAEKADEEGYPGVARIFRAAAKSEMYHAISHMKALGTIQGTLDNLKAAIEDENYESKKMYPAMVQDAVAENEIEARHSLEYAMAIEMIHAKLFKKALENPESIQEDAYFVCPLCGNVVPGKPPRKCPYCGVDAEQFVEVT
jgi:rubrerythrin